MGSSFCKHENKENCELLKNPCVPGQKGCVLKGKFIVNSLQFTIDKKTYKNRNIARFNDK
jgi:hypothetical protein